jgi:hypothetical protein
VLFMLISLHQQIKTTTNNLNFKTMNTTTLKKDNLAIREYLNNCTDNDLLIYYNTYCEENKLHDDKIYYNEEEFFNTFFDGKVLEVVRAINYGSYEYNDNFVMFDGYDNLQSFNRIKDNIDIGEIVNDIFENPHRYNIDLEEE